MATRSVPIFRHVRHVTELTGQGMTGSDEAFYAAITRISKRMSSPEESLTGLFDGMLYHYFAGQS